MGCSNPHPHCQVVLSKFYLLIPSNNLGCGCFEFLQNRCGRVHIFRTWQPQKTALSVITFRSTTHRCCQITSSENCKRRHALSFKTVVHFLRSFLWVFLLQERVVVESEHWVCVVPYWAVWPYETMLLPKRHVLRIQDLGEDERNGKIIVGV